MQVELGFEFVIANAGFQNIDSPLSGRLQIAHEHRIIKLNCSAACLDQIANLFFYYQRVGTSDSLPLALIKTVCHRIGYCGRAGQIHFYHFSGVPPGKAEIFDSNRLSIGQPVYDDRHHSFVFSLAEGNFFQMLKIDSPKTSQHVHYIMVSSFLTIGYNINSGLDLVSDCQAYCSIETPLVFFRAALCPCSPKAGADRIEKTPAAVGKQIAGLGIAADHCGSNHFVGVQFNWGTGPVVFRTINRGERRIILFCSENDCSSVSI